MFAAVDPSGVIYATAAILLVMAIVAAVLWIMSRFKDDA